MPQLTKGRLNRLRVLMLGNGDPVPSFIQRRIQGLVKAGVDVVVAVDSKRTLKDLEGTTIVRLGAGQTLRQQASTICRACLQPRLFLRLLFSRPEITLFRRFKWAIKYFPLAKLLPPDVVHIQWLALASDYQWLREFFRCPFVASARGSQVTVYPITRFGQKAKIIDAIRQVDFLHCVSIDIAAACQSLGGVENKIVLNYNGIDLKHFRPDGRAKPTDPFTIVSIGSLIWRKGLYYQLLILKMLLRDCNVRLWLVGGGDDYEGVFYTAHRLGITENVEFLGRIEPEALPGVLNKAHIYLTTSAAEGLANSVVEAIACGLPVVSFDCEGMNEAIENQESGFILPFGDIDGAVEKIMYLIKHPEVRDRMGEQARRTAVAKFDDQLWVSHMVNFYNAIKEK